jgi:hypothetical protein
MELVVVDILMVYLKITVCRMLSFVKMVFTSEWFGGSQDSAPTRLRRAYIVSNGICNLTCRTLVCISPNAQTICLWACCECFHRMLTAMTVGHQVADFSYEQTRIFSIHIEIGCIVASKCCKKMSWLTRGWPHSYIFKPLIEVGHRTHNLGPHALGTPSTPRSSTSTKRRRHPLLALSGRLAAGSWKFAVSLEHGGINQSLGWFRSVTRVGYFSFSHSHGDEG